MYNTFETGLTSFDTVCHNAKCGSTFRTRCLVLQQLNAVRVACMYVMLIFVF